MNAFTVVVIWLTEAFTEPISSCIPFMSELKEECMSLTSCVDELGHVHQTKNLELRAG
jgi:hypothetical protein